AGQLLAQDVTVTSWMINTTDLTGQHYLEGNSTPISDDYPANVQMVQYSDDNAYVNCSGIPAYIVGPYPDGNPALATDNEWLFRIPINPTPASNATTTPMGPIGVFVNGVPMYNDADGASYSSQQNADDMMGGDGVWNRNAILAENDGFDCAKGHPSPIFNGPPGQGSLEGGTYHHHQNPVAFNLAEVVLSDICDMYLADGLYTIDETVHSPLIGFAFDGYPVYGAVGYANADGTGGLEIIASSYQERDITTRTTYADGSTVTAGPDVSAQYPIGWYKEDYEYVAGSGHLDEFNGRECVTPEYPDGTYAYFATVDADHNSVYPYLVGPQYYGVVDQSNFTSMGGGNSVTIDEDVTLYDPTVSIDDQGLNIEQLNVFPNPSSDFIAVQLQGINKQDIKIELYDLTGKKVQESTIRQGSTIWHLDVRTLYSGEYLLKVISDSNTLTQRVMVSK
ncbi:MAG: YHYH protein, partial [Flavobacteriales bacterium]